MYSGTMWRTQAKERLHGTREGERRERKKEREGKKKGRETDRGRRRKRRVKEKGEVPTIPFDDEPSLLGSTSSTAHYVQVPLAWHLRRDKHHPNPAAADLLWQPTPEGLLSPPTLPLRLAVGNPARGPGEPLRGAPTRQVPHRV